MKKRICMWMAALLMMAAAVPGVCEMLYVDNRETDKIHPERLNMRTEPTKDGDLIGLYYSGAEVEVLADFGEWVQIAHAGGTGYAAKRYICFVRAQQHVQLVVEDGEGKTFVPAGGITARIVTGEID